MSTYVFRTLPYYFLSLSNFEIWKRPKKEYVKKLYFHAKTWTKVRLRVRKLIWKQKFPKIFEYVKSNYCKKNFWNSSNFTTLAVRIIFGWNALRWSVHNLTFGAEAASNCGALVVVGRVDVAFAGQFVSSRIKKFCVASAAKIRNAFRVWKRRTSGSSARIGKALDFRLIVWASFWSDAKFKAFVFGAETIFVP